MRVTHTTLAPIHSQCSTTFWPTAHHLYITMIFTRQDVVTRVPAPGGGTMEIPSTVNTLERSDDEGRTWVRADGGLVGESSTFSVTQGENEDTLMATADSPQFPDAPYWQSHDAGRSWRHLDLPLRQGDLDLDLLSLDRGLRPPVYGYNPGPYSNWHDFDLRLAQLGADGHSWTLLPSLPVPGATPDRTGLLQVLGTLPDGRVFALGVSPDRGVPPTPPSAGLAPNPSDDLASSWVWVWDPVAVRWAVVMSPLEVAPHRGYGCGGCWEASLTRASGRDAHGRAVFGTYVWLRDWFGAESAAYRLFVPDA
jgi:hypothetical protein